MIRHIVVSVEPMYKSLSSEFGFILMFFLAFMTQYSFCNNP